MVDLLFEKHLNIFTATADLKKTKQNTLKTQETYHKTQLSKVGRKGQQPAKSKKEKTEQI